MSFLARFTPVSVTVEKYEESIRRLEEGDFDWPPDGLEYHVCFGPADNIRVSEIWASEEQFAAFGEHLMPVLADIGIEVSPPETMEVHNTIKP
jgi:hypothetical protein